MKQNDNDTTRKASIRNQINENLRKVYEESLNEDVPDRFRDLLAQLRAKEQEGRA